ncbi:hypothetical protein CYY_007554 [Polysphondylium violaceum]|uniref:Uncharacterized protein n=1 Tax=Polysphondylium violaceum TaxID=133409 RepID=A0A8J4PNE1_9MYCE|nr:hypothetical protein CYY_007554 [Polysphondylium violaceum]
MIGNQNIRLLKRIITTTPTKQWLPKRSFCISTKWSEGGGGNGGTATQIVENAIPLDSLSREFKADNEKVRAQDLSALRAQDIPDMISPLLKTTLKLIDIPIEEQREIIMDFMKRHGYQWDDFYTLKYTEFSKEININRVFKLYSGSTQMMLQAVFPEREWEYWKFNKNSVKFEITREMQLQCIRAYGVENNLDTPDKWYRAGLTYIGKIQTSSSPLSTNEIIQLVVEAHPEMKFSKWRFLRAKLDIFDDPAVKQDFIEYFQSVTKKIDHLEDYYLFKCRDFKVNKFLSHMIKQDFNTKYLKFLEFFFPQVEWSEDIYKVIKTSKTNHLSASKKVFTYTIINQHFSYNPEFLLKHNYISNEQYKEIKAKKSDNSITTSRHHLDQIHQDLNNNSIGNSRNNSYNDIDEFDNNYDIDDYDVDESQDRLVAQEDSHYDEYDDDYHDHDDLGQDEEQEYDEEDEYDYQDLENYDYEYSLQKRFGKKKPNPIHKSLGDVEENDTLLVKGTSSVRVLPYKNSKRSKNRIIRESAIIHVPVIDDYLLTNDTPTPRLKRKLEYKKIKLIKVSDPSRIVDAKRIPRQYKGRTSIFNY